MLKEIVCVFAAVVPLGAQGAPGLRLFAPFGNHEVRLVDGHGVAVQTWPGFDNLSVAIAPDGSLLRSVIDQPAGFPGTTGRLQRLDIDGNVTWDLVINDHTRLMHHDIEVMPNGNVLVMVADFHLAPFAIARGRNPALLPANEWLPESILEIRQTGPTTGDVVWEWHVSDHTIQDFDITKLDYGVVSDHPELVDINYPPVVLTLGDWTHCNGIDYDPINDWIVISARAQDEVWLIDHSTTTAEAAGHTGGARGRGGDLLWRWGNPEAYRRGTAADRTLFQQHDPRFIPPGYPGEGNLTIFNNTVTPTSSAVIEIELPVDTTTGLPFVESSTGRFGPTAPVWSFSEPGFYSSFISGAERLQNGNTLICSGAQRRVFEVTPTGETVWSFTHPNSVIFHAHSIDRRLWASTDELSVGGGVVEFTHILDTERAGDLYFLLGTLAGSSPGTALPGGLTLPLNTDGLLVGMAMFPNVGVFVDTLGPVGANGRAHSALAVPPGLLLPVLVGAELTFAHAICDTSGNPLEVSNTVTVTIVP